MTDFRQKTLFLLLSSIDIKSGVDSDLLIDQQGVLVDHEQLNTKIFTRAIKYNIYMWIKCVILFF